MPDARPGLEEHRALSDSIGGLLPALDDVADRPVVALMGAMLGAALGLIVGSFAGYEQAGKGWSARSNAPR